MKKTILSVVFALLIGAAFGQTVKKGALLGLHVMTVDLKPNATMDQFKSFFLTKVIPAYEKAFSGAKGYIASGVRGEHANSLAIIWLFETEEARNKYFGASETDSPTELGKAAMEKIASVDKELESLGTYTSTFTDWVIR